MDPSELEGLARADWDIDTRRLGKILQKGIRKVRKRCFARLVAAMVNRSA